MTFEMKKEILILSRSIKELSEEVIYYNKEEYIILCEAAAKVLYDAVEVDNGAFEERKLNDFLVSYQTFEFFKDSIVDYNVDYMTTFFRVSSFLEEYLEYLKGLYDFVFFLAKEKHKEDKILKVKKIFRTIGILIFLLSLIICFLFFGSLLFPLLMFCSSIILTFTREEKTTKKAKKVRFFVGMIASIIVLLPCYVVMIDDENLLFSTLLFGIGFLTFNNVHMKRITKGKVFKKIILTIMFSIAFAIMYNFHLY